MWVLVLFSYGPVLAAAIVAVIAWTIGRKRRELPDPRTRLLMCIAGALPLLVVVGVITIRFVSPTALPYDIGGEAVRPIVLGVVAVLLSSIPPRSQPATGSASLARRTFTSFVPLSQVAWVGALASVIIAITIALGLASSPDNLGRSTAYRVQMGTSGTEGATEIYGWYYSTPSLVGIAVLLIATSIGWGFIVRSPWKHDARHDAAVRRTRAASITRLAAGGLLVHLSAVLTSAGGTASLVVTTRSSDLGTVTITSDFAALVPALYGLSLLCLAAGLALWMLTLIVASAGSRMTEPSR